MAQLSSDSMFYNETHCTDGLLTHVPKGSDNDQIHELYNKTNTIYRDSTITLLVWLHMTSCTFM